jgi:hypothetical protein
LRSSRSQTAWSIPRRFSRVSDEAGGGVENPFVGVVGAITNPVVGVAGDYFVGVIASRPRAPSSGSSEMPSSMRPRPIENPVVGVVELPVVERVVVGVAEGGGKVKTVAPG